MSALLQEAVRTADALARCTLYAWVIELGYITPTGRLEVITRVVQAPLTAAPEALDLLPDGATFLRAEVFPATRFDDMPLATRARHKWHYKAYLLWRKARAMGKSVEEAGLLIDPIEIDELAESWSHPGRFVGD